MFPYHTTNAVRGHRALAQLRTLAFDTGSFAIVLRLSKTNRDGKERLSYRGTSVKGKKCSPIEQALLKRPASEGKKNKAGCRKCVLQIAHFWQFNFFPAISAAPVPRCTPLPTAASIQRALE